jgi:hypothetical protein
MFLEPLESPHQLWVHGGDFVVFRLAMHELLGFEYFHN